MNRVSPCETKHPQSRRLQLHVQYFILSDGEMVDFDRTLGWQSAKGRPQAPQLTFLSQARETLRRTRGQPPVWIAIALFLGCLSLSSQALAQSFSVRSFSAGRATQWNRTNFSVAAQRQLTEMLTLRGYDLLGTQTGSLNFALSLRYVSDFGLPPDLVDNPYFQTYSNQLAIDLFYLEARPLPTLRFVLGRQWNQGPLGPIDFDGLHSEYHIRRLFQTDTRSTFSAYAGRPVEVGLGLLGSDLWPNQALNPDPELGPWSETFWHFVAGAQATLDILNQFQLAVAYRRQWRQGLEYQSGQLLPLSPDDSNPEAEFAQDLPRSTLASERIGLGLSWSILSDLNLVGVLSYHAILDAIDRADLQLVYRLPIWNSFLSIGAEHQHPWFDSASIFNVFGAQPYQGLRTSWQTYLAFLRTQFDAQVFHRLFHGDTASVWDGAADALDSRVWGASLSHLTQIQGLQRTWKWSSRLGWQQGDYGSSSAGSDQPQTQPARQWMVESQLEVPVFDDHFFVHGRGFWMLSEQAWFRQQLGPRHIAAAVLGFRAPFFGAGHLAFFGERRMDDVFMNSTSVYGTLDLEVWP